MRANRIFLVKSLYSILANLIQKYREDRCEVRVYAMKFASVTGSRDCDSVQVPS